MVALEQLEVIEGKGLAGDHYQGGYKEARQVTLIQKEQLSVVSKLLDRKAEVPPELLRRNLVIASINLISLKDKHFRIGEDVILSTTGICAPCSRMEENLGPGGFNAMRGHGGITARIVQGGTIRLNDQVCVLKDYNLK